ncbi:MAG: hypothetical protein Rubg2KO_39800 [Rubricoccaceae bacterium]
MAKERKAIVVHYMPDAESPTLTELNELLNDGWRLMSTTAMGGAGTASSSQFAALIILEREEQKTVGGFTAG